MNREFVEKHVNFRVGNTDIGYELQPEHVLETRAAHSQDPGVSRPGTFEDYAELLKTLHGGARGRISGVPLRSGWSAGPATPIPR